MLIYKRTLKVTQEDFEAKPEEIKNAIRGLVDEYLKDFNESFGEVSVSFVESMKEELKKEYNFIFKKEEKTLATLKVPIRIVEAEDFDKTDDISNYTYY